METQFRITARLFERNAQAVDRLLDFGNEIIDIAVGGLKELEGQLDERHLHSAVTLVRNRAAVLSNVKHGDSLRPQYEAMFNQCVVLLVSYFGAAMHTLFRQGVAAALRNTADVPATKQELKVSWRGLVQSEGEREGMFADLLIAQNDVSFQDMQSIARAFKGHLQIDLQRSNHANTVILGQAARHVIVHASGIIDERMIRQVSAAEPRDLKEQIVAGAILQFSPDEVRLLGNSMRTYVNTAAHYLDEASSRWSNEFH